VAAAVAELRRELAETPYAAPEAHRLRDLGLGPKELAAAVRAGELAPVAEGVYLTPEALRDALVPLRALPEPFSLSEARRAWGTSRRVAVPLLERLDRLGVTERLPDDRRRLRAAAGR
jgi:selenocysteine-specific elongation factor